jgi:secreted PhoX family phosphatase
LITQQFLEGNELSQVYKLLEAGKMKKTYELLHDCGGRKSGNSQNNETQQKLSHQDNMLFDALRIFIAS